MEREAARALEVYGLLVVPGLELTYNDTDPRLSAHALAHGLRSFVSVDEGIDGAIETAVQAGAALVAAHPYDDEPAPDPGRLTQRFARDAELASLLRGMGALGPLAAPLGVFARCASAVCGCAACANRSVPCARDEEALIAHLRSRRPVFITQVGVEAERNARPRS